MSERLEVEGASSVRVSTMLTITSNIASVGSWPLLYFCRLRLGMWGEMGVCQLGKV